MNVKSFDVWRGPDKSQFHLFCPLELSRYYVSYFFSTVIKRRRHTEGVWQGEYGRESN